MLDKGNSGRDSRVLALLVDFLMVSFGGGRGEGCFGVSYEEESDSEPSFISCLENSGPGVALSQFETLYTQLLDFLKHSVLHNQKLYHIFFYDLKEYLDVFI